jgi:hypothetical protein
MPGSRLALLPFRDTISLEDDHSRRLRHRSARCTISALIDPRPDFTNALRLGLPSVGGRRFLPFQRDQEPQRRNGEQADGAGDVVGTQPDGSPDRTGRHRLAAVAVRRTLVPLFTMAPPPMKPMPVISPSRTRALPSGEPRRMPSVAWMKPQLAMATSGKVRKPALRSVHSRPSR